MTGKSCVKEAASDRILGKSGQVLAIHEAEIDRSRHNKYASLETKTRPCFSKHVLVTEVRKGTGADPSGDRDKEKEEYMI